MIDNKNMITLFIWLGVIGGVLIALSIAGYRVYSGKINNERENNSILQRNEIKDNINKSKYDLSEQIDKNDTKIINKLDDVGNKVNTIYESDESNIEYISFPDNGNFGKNILDQELSKIESGTYSMIAILPKNKIIKVKVSGDNWSFPIGQAIGGWDYSDLDNNDISRVFTTIKYGRTDFKFYLKKGETEIKLFVENNEKPKWTKTIQVE
jgi:hypothetical protein